MMRAVKIAGERKRTDAELMQLKNCLSADIAQVRVYRDKLHNAYKSRVFYQPTIQTVYVVLIVHLLQKCSPQRKQTRE